MRRTATLVGVLFWVSDLSTLIGNVIAGPVPTAANALADMSPKATAVIVGTLIAHVNDAAIIGYAVALFPVLKRYGEALALAYVGFKLLEAALLMVSAAALLSLVALSHAALAAGTSDAAAFRAAAESTLAQQFWTARLAALAYLVATPILSFLLYRSRLVPRFIAVWGFVGLTLLAIGLAIGVGDPTRGGELGQLLVVPIILWELFFATWLIVRGFAGVAVTARFDAATET